MEQRYHLLFEHLPDAFAYYQILTDERGIPVDYLFLEVNPAFEKMTGLQREEILGKKITAVHPEILHSAFDWIALYGRVAAGGGNIRCEHYCKPAGRWYEITAYSDTPGYFAVICRDLTEQRRVRQGLEEKLKNSEARYRSVVENVNDALFIYDFRGKILDLNAAACQMLGYARHELLGANLEIFRSPGDQQRYPERLAQLLQDKQLCFKSTGLNKNGTAAALEINMRLLSRQGNGLLQSTVRDMNRREQDEQQIARYAAELEKLHLKLDEEINRARHSHARTLPKDLPAVSGLSFAACYQPAECPGGDFYNVEQLDEKLVIYLSDVTGHGIDGAILSEFIKHTLKGYFFFSPEEKIRPEAILRYLSAQFQQKNLPGDYFICIFLAVLDLRSLELTYTAAGFQDAPLVRLGDGECLQLASKGLFLSPAFSEELLNLQENSIRLTPGTTIFFHTDGLSEQIAQNACYGARLPAVFYANSHLPPQQIAWAIREDFRRFNGGTLQSDDDIAFLILQVDPGPKKTERLELASDFAVLKQLREKASAMLDNDNEKTALFLGCLHELAANAIEHGNRLERKKMVSIDLVITDRFMQASIEDQGGGFNWRARANNPLELDGNSERGRGIAMARLCSEQLFYNERGNRVTFMIKRFKEKNNHAS